MSAMVMEEVEEWRTLLMNGVESDTYEISSFGAIRLKEQNRDLKTNLL